MSSDNEPEITFKVRRLASGAYNVTSPELKGVDSYSTSLQEAMRIAAIGAQHIWDMLQEDGTPEQRAAYEPFFK